MSPVLPHAPGSLYGSVLCILFLEKGVKCKRHYYCSIIMVWEPCYVPWHCARDMEVSDSLPLSLRSSALSQGDICKTPLLRRQCYFHYDPSLCCHSDLASHSAVSCFFFFFLSWVVECRGKWSTMRKPRGLDFYLISTLTRDTISDKASNLSVS